MNQTELKALSGPISNDARVLYCLALRPDVDTQTGLSKPINYKALLALLNSTETRYSLGREINGLIKELLELDLVALPKDCQLNRSFNGKSVLLPLAMHSQDDYAQLHMQWLTMSKDWQPQQTLFNELCTLVGLVDKEYDQEDLGEFIAYWMGRPNNQFSQYQWTQKFVFQLKQRRLAKGVKVVQKVGTQLVKPKAAVEADDNARKLVEKYSNKQ